MIITLGVEEELQVVDAETGALLPHDVEDTKRKLANGPGGITTEIHQCAVELQTPVDAHPDRILTSLSILRTVARKQLELQGRRLIAAGLHPFSSWLGQPLHDDAQRYPHYAHLLEEYGDIARSAMSFGLHVHLGLPRPEFRMPVMNALRSVLPDVLALSANSPFHEGRDTGLASWRHSVLGRYPRMGIPEIWPDERSYFGHIERLRRVGSLEPGEGMWDDLRLHHRYGTLEVRICDAHHSLERIWLIVALLQCEARTLIDEAASGKLPVPVPRAYIEEDKWRARRHGLSASLVDWQRDEAVATPLRFERWLKRLHPAAVELGLWRRLEKALDAAIEQPSGAEQQRAWHAGSGSFAGLVRHLVEATAEPRTTSSSIERRYRAFAESIEDRLLRAAPSSNIRVGEAPPRTSARASRRMEHAPRRPAVSD